MPAKPSLDLLRSLTDEHVLRALLDHAQLTRVELASVTGISKPTISQSVRRLEGSGLVRDTGARTSGRGRVGSYYALSPAVGTTLVTAIAPAGVVTEVLDVHGVVLGRADEAVPRTTRAGPVRRALRAAVSRACAQAGGPADLAVVSAADPVDRWTGRLVHLPDAPFLVGELDPVNELRTHLQAVVGDVVVDNDVNWAARAEQLAGGDGDGPGDLGDFSYVHLGEGLGCAVVSDGEVRRGHHGLSGEVAHIITRGPGGRAVQFTEVFQLLGLRAPTSAAIDVDLLLGRVDAGGAAARRLVESLGEAVAGVLAAVLGLSDPRVVIVGGSWGAHPGILSAVQDAFARQPRSATVRAARVTDDPAFTGARHHAVQELRAHVLTLGARDTDS